MFDPVIGRFISEDPIGLDGGDTNFYRYVGNNAVNLVDPTGHIAEPIIPLQRKSKKPKYPITVSPPKLGWPHFTPIDQIPGYPTRGAQIDIRLKTTKSNASCTPKSGEYVCRSQGIFAFPYLVKGTYVRNDILREKDRHVDLLEHERLHLWLGYYMGIELTNKLRTLEGRGKTKTAAADDLRKKIRKEVTRAQNILDTLQNHSDRGQEDWEKRTRELIKNFEKAHRRKKLSIKNNIRLR